MTNVPKHENVAEWVLLCDYFVVGQNNKFSLINVFEDVTPDTLPGILPQFFIVAKIFKPIAGTVSLTLEFPDGNRQLLGENELVTDANANIGISSWGLNGMLLTQEGKHRFVIASKSHVIGQVDLEVVVAGGSKK